jgi:hypothetical protein
MLLFVAQRSAPNLPVNESHFLGPGMEGYQMSDGEDVGKKISTSVVWETEIMMDLARFALLPQLCYCYSSV